MNMPGSILTPNDVLRTARTWKVKLSSDQARTILKKNSLKINRAIKEAAHEVLREQVEQYCLEREDKELR